MIENYASPISNKSMDRIYYLQSKLMNNVTDIDAVTHNIEKLTVQTPDDIDSLEDLYKKEFKLYMDNIAIYEDLMNLIDKEKPDMYNELVLARIKRQTDELLLVEWVEM